ncbi:hypothetical protein SPSIL_057610 [Sporomusa silvacetica DSM 10669]|uniref:Lin1244/Lin1753-like N-terminal domain-containing protein n=1 Tax=Sporomusa silvacetica DSM 10669 TaxID=1123289 RepID=A0ABZ3IV34_9FIRM|nr:DUF4373 domain-containing protein [Sporomusa silvacetica]OZC14291.1 hypothetical protein SPSIL_50180 [Sporomusa silvacetica DSM 10669]
MARPNKEGLDYFSLDTDIIGDDKIKLIKAKHGLTGFAIVILLLTKIYKEGYYYQWSEDEQYLFADDARVDINTVIDIVNDCINKGFFNQELYQKYGILTSRGIQKRFLQACTRRKKLTLIREYFIVDNYMKEVFEGKKIIVSFNSINVDINPVKPELLPAETPQKEKEIEKEIETKENNVCANEVGVDNLYPLGNAAEETAVALTDSGQSLELSTEFKSFWQAYPRKACQERGWEAWKAVLADGYRAIDLVVAAGKYSVRVRADGTAEKFIKMPHTFLAEKVFEKYMPACPKCGGSGYRGNEDGEVVVCECKKKVKHA